MKYWLNLLISIDQFFNALAGGNPDVTISGHVGLKADSAKRWEVLRQLIDKTFLPIEKNHCIKAFVADNDIDDGDNFYRVAIISIFGCLLLFLPIRIIALCR